MSTATEYREQAAAARQRVQESWDRSDTDGFLSQWAGDLYARKMDLAAEVAENGGLWTFEDAFVDADGNAAPARLVTTRYGTKVAMFASWDDFERFNGPVKAWCTPSNRALRKYGLRLATRTVAAKVVMAGSGKGLSGAMTCHPAVVPVTRYGRTDVVTVSDWEDR